VSQYESYKEPSLNKRRIKHEDLQPLIDRYKNQAGITVTKVGESIEGRSLSLLSLEMFFYGLKCMETNLQPLKLFLIY